MANKKIKITNEEDKILIKKAIAAYIELKSSDAVVQAINIELDLVQTIVENKLWVTKLFGSTTWDEVDKIRRQEKAELKDREYEELMSNILFYMINSLYNYNEICEKNYITDNIFKSMIDNEKYIEEHFGIQMLQKLRESREIRKCLPIDKRDIKSSRQIVKDPNHRKLIKSNIIVVSNYEFELIKKVSIFFDNGGNTEKASNNSEYSIKDLYTSLCDDKLKNILKESVYEQLEVLREVDSILTQNRMTERKELIRTIILAIHSTNGDLTAIERKTGYSKMIIERVIQHPYVSIVCNSLNIEVSLDMLHYEDEYNENYPKYQVDSLDKLEHVDEQERKLILDIADYIIENKATYKEAADKFKLSKKTICVKMKDKLPHISKEKSEKVNEIVKGNTALSITDSPELQARVELEYALFMRGYTLEQVADLVNNSYSSTQRDLAERLSQIDKEKGALVKQRLQYNQSKNYINAQKIEK